MRRKTAWLCSLLGLFLMGTAPSGEEKTSTPPWPRRVHHAPDRPFRSMTPIAAWPPEPSSPARIDPQQFASAWTDLCGTVSPKKIRAYSRWVLDYSGQFEVDPFMIAALIYRHGRCRLDAAGPFTALDAHRPMVAGGAYRYWRRHNKGWRRHALSLPRFPFERRILKHPEAQIYFSTAMLSIFSAQCPDLDPAFRSTPHRHPVSHMIWGDRVLGRQAEDLVLLARRRLLQYYLDLTPPPLSRFGPVRLYCPLDGAPRQLSGRFRDPRPGNRRHNAVDFVSTTGEAVRAMADGTVQFAGFLHRRKGLRMPEPERATKVPGSVMGIGGLFVILRHDHGLRTGYFHLSDYTVKRGDRIMGGQLIGHVGRTGIKESDPHLHFEMRRRKHRIDPARYLRPYLAPTKKSSKRRVGA